MRIKRVNILLFIYVISIPLILSSCKKDPEPEVIPDIHVEQKRFITEAMTDMYYWYDKMPSSVSSKGKDIFEHFEMLLYSEDRWSWMMDGESYIQSETGVYKSWGGVLRQAIDHYKDYDIKMAMVYPNSPFAEKGIKRGWTLTHIGGQAVMQLVSAGTFDTEYNRSPNSFTFRDTEGKVHNFDITSRTISTRSSLGYNIFTRDDFEGLTSPVGYFNYLTFNKNMLSDIDNAMAEFKTHGVTDIIIDLRYNGGGDVSAMDYLANYLAPQSADNSVLAKRKHNNKLSQLDENSMSIISRDPEKALDLKRIFFIIGGGTASASEVLINGLDPMMDVVTVGRVSYGKFNGMYVIPFPANNYTSPEYVFLPVSFFTVNKNGQGAYTEGLTPDNSRPDDLYHDFGVEEDNIRACLTYIATGSYPSLPATASTKAAKGYRIETEVDKPGYGLFIDKEIR